jgi:hypothetical protein
VLLYTSVDYWLWFLFVTREGCTRFVGAVPGYQVEVLEAKSNGYRQLAAWTYPLQGHEERYELRGSAYVLSSAAAP